MKFGKRGFTLAELLLCLGIIGIVSALSVTATKQSTEKAFRGYYYTGVVNLYNAVASFEENNLFANGSINSTNTFANQLGTFFDVNANGDIIRAKNGITYNVTRGVNNAFTIEITVPQAKSRRNPQGTDSVSVAYIRNANGNHTFIPFMDQNETTNLQERRDLLPTYFDDGTTGRVVNGRRNERRYRSFRETYCRINANAGVNKPIDTKNITLSCNGIPIDTEAQNGVLKFEKPSRAR